MPFNLIDTDCSDLVIDYEFEIANKDLLAEYVGELVLGHYFHILNIINSLSSSSSTPSNKIIDFTIEKLNVSEKVKVIHRDGWLFQMISWLVLAHRNRGNNYHTQHPHFAPAQHGIDGLSIILKPDNTIDKIIITEDKCTTNPRDTIRKEVFPEFKDFEDGKKDSALIGVLSSLIAHLDAGAIFQSVQNDIYNTDLRMYRIGITREDSHQSLNGRRRLFKKYDDYISGATCSRRSGATVYLDAMRNWMQDFSDKVINYLESKKS
ncbi:hypothetical protein C3B47_13900 [Flavobacterium columnare]|uniref:hypothetical protein n=1 Tax=Flavobacterium columnare TaxID=996 RepID=UPI000D1AD7A1|nr:hypothetical protein [Flavobacterium columnare]MBF6653949.1 hypothetical protein [Flavobacterium columnare]MBF6654163.1 hypothetical protein [Flavobacterium columnare]MBF6657442.1 hypothetical protein [Flavobacterium columnare]PTD15227.1 hypothetical protein C6N29_12750 [Flavobacterium columnare]